MLLSAAEGADVMDPAAWTLTAALPFDGAWLAGGPAGTGGGASPGAAAAPAPGGRLPGGKEAEGDAHGGAKDAAGSPGPALAPGHSPAANAADGPGGYLEGATYTVNDDTDMTVSAVPVDSCCHCIYQHRKACCC